MPTLGERASHDKIANGHHSEVVSNVRGNGTSRIVCPILFQLMRITLVQLLSHGFSRVICSELLCLPALPEMPQASE
ncbi:hypothetical protein, partial [Bradyrhizobium sp. RT4b]|uniref:hypothetical protein n=1 Tax=Bradyrhizobium sp. RT4b TaxID=3156379 RepID=UPI0033996628